MKLRNLLNCTLIVLGSSLTAQVTFVDGKTEAFAAPVHSGMAVAIADVDGDGRDDMVSFDYGVYLTVSLFRGVGIPMEQVFKYPVPVGDVWSVVVGDVTGDGRADVMTGSIFDVLLFEQMDNFTFVRKEVYGIDWLPQTANLVDYDNDSDLDFFLCNDEGTSLLLENDGTGGFTKSEAIDFTTSPVSDNSGNYGSLWTDIDNDGDVDLYIAKCKAGVNDPADPRRVNALYVNNGDGSFTEQAAQFGLAEGLQSWSADAGDVDNDGDMDIFVTNHDGPHKLFINEGATFVEYQYLPELIESFAFQGVFYDMDNNGWLDIVISDGKDNNILYNENMSFTKADYQSIGERSITSIVGDLNSDGFGDIWAQYPRDGFTGSGGTAQADKVWWNNGNQNNYITITLAGPEGKSVAGARVTLATSTGPQMREVKLGTSYGQQGSANLHFGLGEGSLLLVITVEWPDGTIKQFDGLSFNVNQHYLIDYEGCFTAIEDFGDEKDQVLCPGGELVLSSAYGDTVQWYPGAHVAPSITVSEVGSYTYQYVDAGGCTHLAEYATVKNEETIYAEVLDTESQLLMCNGASIVLEAEPGLSYAWNTGDTTSTIDVVAKGDYIVTVTTPCQIDYVSDTVKVSVIEIGVPQLQGDSVHIGSTATLSSSSPTTNWYDDPEAFGPLGVGEFFETAPLSGPTYYYAADQHSDYYLEGQVGLSELPIDNKYSNDFLSGGLIFIVNKPVIINSVKLETDLAGPRTILITSDDLLDTLYVLETEIAEGESRVVLDAELPAGRYRMHTDNQRNIENFGFSSPKLTRTVGEEVTYPYELYDDLTIIGGTNGASRYFYFYDWEVTYKYKTCESERVPVLAYTFGVSTDEETDHIASIHPNPATNAITIGQLANVQSLTLYSSDGAIIREVPTLGAAMLEIDLIDVPSGLYVIEGRTSDRVDFRQKILIIK